MTLLEEIQLRLVRLPLEKQSEVLDFVSFLQERVVVTSTNSLGEERKKRIENAFLQLATLKTFADITNPVEWQKQIRA
jgi:hypothetical protein